MFVVPLPALADNYIWLLHDGRHAIVVDPGESTPVVRALAEHRLILTAILLTHHHADHIGGAMALRKRYGVPVYAPQDERIEATTHAVQEGSCVTLPHPAARFEVIAIPGHTLSHIAYVGAGVLLCGDTLFSLGCGRLFEGTPEQMLASLDRIAALPGELLVCCGHEYTEANGRFAYTIDPVNPALQARLGQVRRLRDDGCPSLPVTLADELASNPFLRTDSPEVMHWARRFGADDRVSRFATLRAHKDEFR